MKTLDEKIRVLEKKFIKNDIIFNIKKHDSLGSKKTESFAKDYHFPQELIEFYSSYNGLFITWFSDQNILCTGRLYIPDIQTLKNYLKNTSKTDLKSFASFIKKGYIPFDVDIINAYVTFIKIEKNKYKLIRVDVYHNEIELSISITTYLEMGIDSGGLYHWQNYISVNTYNAFKKYSYDGFFEFIKHKLNTTLSKPFYQDGIVNDFTFSNIKSIKLNIPQKAHVNIKNDDLGCSNVEIRKAEMSIGGKLPNSFIKWGYGNNGMDIHWVLNNYSAKFKVLGIEEIFGGPKHSEMKTWKNSYAKHLGLQKSHEEEYGHFYPFIFEESGHTVFKIENNEIQLYFIEDLEPFSIHLTFDQFIQKLSKCAGVSGWQHFFTDQYSKKNPKTKDIIQKINICFPKIDINTFMN